SAFFHNGEQYHMMTQSQKVTAGLHGAKRRSRLKGPSIMSAPTLTVTHEMDLIPGRWVLDQFHSSVLFSIRHLGLAKVRGRFDRFDTTLEVGPTLAETNVAATIDLGSINTNNADRDAHLRSTDFFSTD